MASAASTQSPPAQRWLALYGCETCGFTRDMPGMDSYDENMKATGVRARELANTARQLVIPQNAGDASTTPNRRSPIHSDGQRARLRYQLRQSARFD